MRKEFDMVVIVRGVLREGAETAQRPRGTL